MYKNAPYWFGALFALSVLGLWPSCFSPGASRATFGQHFHAIAMLVWVALLVFSALIAVADNLAKLPQPYPPIGLGFFSLGLASACCFAMCYMLAIIKRREIATACPLHGRHRAGFHRAVAAGP